MDELYLDNIDEFVNDHNKIVGELSGVLSGRLPGRAGASLGTLEAN